MKLLAFSDSHGRTLEMIAAIEREQPEAVLHLGDCIGDAHELERVYPSTTIYRVRGNNDWSGEGVLQACVQPGGVPLLLTHGHRERVGLAGCGTLPAVVRQKGCVMGLFGHTHRPFLEFVDGILLCNPGSIRLPRGGSAAGYARLSIQKKQLCTVELLTEDGAVWRSLRL